MTTWYVNVELSPSRQREFGGLPRSWEDCRRFGFISAGHGRNYSRQLEKLLLGDAIYAYVPGHGYVGFGHVTSTAQMARDVQLADGPLLEHDLEGSFLRMNRNNREESEYVVRVDWMATLPRAEAVSQSGIFNNRNVVCELRDPKTLRLLRQRLHGRNAIRREKRTNVKKGQLGEKFAEVSAFEGMKREAKWFARTRNRPLRNHVLAQAKGVCCACKTDYSKLLGGDGKRVLQVHHRRQLADYRIPGEETTVEDLAVVCANCHLLLHLDRETVLDVEKLAQMLRDEATGRP